MSEKNQFKGMVLDRSIMEETILEFCNGGLIGFLESSLEIKKYGERHLSYTINLEEKINFNLYYKDDGTTTLAVGGNEDNKEMCIKLGHYLLSSNCALGKNSDNMMFVVEGINIDEYNIIKELLGEEKYISSISEKSESDILNAISVTGNYEDTNTVTFYKTTNKILVQGKPLPVFSTISLMISSVTTQENIITSFNNYYNVDIELPNIEKLYDTYFPISHQIHKGKFRKTILQGVYNLQLNGEFFDYTMIVFPAFRALEGHLIQILNINNITRSNSNGFGNIFTRENGSPFHLIATQKSKISNTLVELHLEKVYNYFHSRRHGYFHWDESCGIESSPIITRIDLAKQMIMECFELIEEYYSK